MRRASICVPSSLKNWPGGNLIGGEQSLAQFRLAQVRLIHFGGSGHGAQRQFALLTQMAKPLAKARRYGFTLCWILCARHCVARYSTARCLATTILPVFSRA